MAFSVVDEDFFLYTDEVGGAWCLVFIFFKFLFLEPLWGSKNKNSPRCARRCEKIFLRKIFSFSLRSKTNAQARLFLFFF